MAKKRHSLTNQELADEFKNPFELVNAAIRMAHHVIESGNVIDGPGQIRNQAHHVLNKIAKKEEWKVEPVRKEEEE